MPPGQHYIILDTETTGFPSNAEDCPVRAIQLGMALVSPTRVVERWAKLVRPPVWAPSADAAEKIHGIHQKRVNKFGVSPGAAWAELEAMLAVWAAVAEVNVGQIPILAWNAKFDTVMLHRLAVDAGMLTPAQARPLPTVRLPLRGTGFGVDAPHGCLMLAFKSWAGATDLRAGGQSLDKARAALGLPARTGHHDAAGDAALTGEVLLAMLGAP